MKPRYKDKRLQQVYDNALKLTYPVSFQKDKIGGSVKFAWNAGYEGLKRPGRISPRSPSWAMYYAGKEKRRLDTIQINKK